MVDDYKLQSIQPEVVLLSLEDVNYGYLTDYYFVEYRYLSIPLTTVS